MFCVGRSSGMQDRRILSIVAVASLLEIAVFQPAHAADSDSDSKSTKEVIVTQTASAENWWTEIGPVVRGNMRMGVKGSSYSRQSATGSLPALPAGVGSESAYADRTYSDGFVKRDSGTGSSQSLDPKATWNWGYNSASQYNAAAQTLAFHATGAPGTVPSNDTWGNGKDATSVGFELAAGRTLIENDRFKLDFAGGFEAAWGVDNNLTTSNFSATSSRLDVTDTYKIGGITVPAAGYRGNYAGPFATGVFVASPVIPEIPGARQVNTVALGSVANAIKFDTSTDHYQLWFGPRVSVKALHWLSFYVNPRVGAALSVVEADRTEKLIATSVGGIKSTIQSWHDSASNSDWAFIGGVTGGATIQLTPRVFADLNAGYEWSSSKNNLNVGPNTLSLNPSGYTAGASIGVKF